ncbi:MAG: hypothetical protein K2Q10_01885, partial [Rhodospirillales bacterium]|nr:hypothetical protein [Rhodospirillales bacterium]
GGNTASYAGSGAVKVDLASHTAYGAHAEGDVLTWIHNLVGSSYSDTLTGDGGANILAGGKGLDILTGGQGADTFAYFAPTDGSTRGTNGLKGSALGDSLTDFQSGLDRMVLDADAFGMAAGMPVKGTNVIVLNTAYNGANAQGGEWAAGKACLIIDSTNTLYYDANGAADGYTVLASIKSGSQLAATDIILQSHVA